MKNLTKVAVLIIAIDLMKDNGKTTTLEVKEALRAEGYFAKQAEVSALMYEIAQEEGWEVNENGNYREYSLDEYIGDIHDDDDDDGDTVEPEGVKIIHKDEDGDPYPVYVKEKSVTRAEPGDWRVTDCDDCVIKYYDAIYTRDEVRNAFSKTVSVAIVDTRAARVK